VYVGSGKHKQNTNFARSLAVDNLWMLAKQAEVKGHSMIEFIIFACIWI
jgi:hypothetical protein